jgi:hypothetical protein
MSSGQELPRWLDLVVLPLFNLALALVVCGVVVLVIGLDPLQVLALLVRGAFGSRIGGLHAVHHAVPASRGRIIDRNGLILPPAWRRIGVFEPEAVQRHATATARAGACWA